jgi:N-dimethylarginine dimethylaminohydrolase
MLSTNEWDPLLHVVVGRADHARLPMPDVSVKAVNYSNVDDLSVIPVGPYPDQIIREANQDLDTLVTVLENLNVKVSRPAIDHVPAYYNYCPRDSVLVHGDLVLAAPQPIRCRRGEHRAMSHIWPTLPAHRLLETTWDYPDDFYNAGQPELLALKESMPAFDAANILRANRDLFYLVSNTGNRAGAVFLQKLLPDCRVWTIQDVYSYSHIDSTIALLREGLMLLNPARIKSKAQLPAPLQSWDVIWAPEPTDIGHWPGYAMASAWISMNLFSVRPDLVILESHQDSLRRELDKWGIDAIMLPGRHQRTLSGGFHCVTLDLERA